MLVRPLTARILSQPAARIQRVAPARSNPQQTDPDTMPQGRALPLLILAWGFVAHGPAAAEPSARDIAEKALASDHLGFSAGRATLALEIRDDKGRVLTRRLEARSRVEGGVRKMRLTFSEPVDQRGLELLLVEQRGQPTLQYLWLPRSAELKRITADDREGQLGGGDFSLRDLERQDLSRADIALLPEAEWMGQRCHVLSLGPKPGERAPGPWDRLVVWVTVEGQIPLRLDFEKARDGGFIATRRLEVKKLARVGRDKRLAPSRLVMSDLVRQTRTTLDITSQDPDAVIPDTVFRPESLGR